MALWGGYNHRQFRFFFQIYSIHKAFNDSFKSSFLRTKLPMLKSSWNSRSNGELLRFLLTFNNLLSQRCTHKLICWSISMLIDYLVHQY